MPTGKLVKTGVLFVLAATLVIGISSCKKEKGCADPEAVNYDPSVKKDDGSCKYAGCTDTAAVNYNPKAKYEDGSCQYATPPPPMVKAYDWVAWGVDWGNAETVTLTFNESPYGFTISNKTLTAGKPYILKIINPVGNTENHTFSTDGPTDFFTAIATRKVQTADAQYKAPFFEEIELLIPSTSDRVAEIYFVAVKTGKYHIVCTGQGHQAGGEEDYITITGDSSLQLDLEVDPAFNTELARDPRKDSSHTVWDTGNRVDTTVTVDESTWPYSFVPETLVINKDIGYKLSIVNPAVNTSWHYYTAPDFYKTVVMQKCRDSHAVIKPYYLENVRLITNTNGTQTDLYIVPTVTGTYQVEGWPPKKGIIVVQ